MTIAAEQARPQSDAPTSSRAPGLTKVLTALTALADGGGQADVTVDELADRIGTSRRTVQRALRDLEAEGLLQRTYHCRHRRPCTYSLTHTR